MTIVGRLKIFAGITCLILLLVLLASVIGLRNADEELVAATRRDTYAHDLLMIKASAAAVMLHRFDQPGMSAVFTASAKVIDDKSAVVQSVIKRAEVRQQFQDMMQEWQRYLVQVGQLKGVSPALADQQLQSIHTTLFLPFFQHLTQFTDARITEAAQGHVKSRQAFDSAYHLIVGAIVVAIVFVLTMTALLIVSLKNNLNAILQSIKPLQKGNLSVRLPVKGRDELATISAAVNVMIDELADVVKQVRDGVETLMFSSGKVSVASQTVAQSANSQSDSSSSIAASVEQMSVSIASLAAMGEQLREVTLQSKSYNNKGNESTIQLRSQIS